MTVIAAEGLSKSFQGKTVLDRISFAVEEGEVFGFLGPNGAGKTTTIRLLLGLLDPTAGTARVLGESLAENTGIRRRIGVLLENNGVSDRLSAYENLLFSAQIYSVENPRERICEILSFVGLGERMYDPVGVYSSGMKRKLGLARATLHDPDILFLDEPTAGLDPEAQRMVRDLILDLSRDEGRTIFLCSHNLDEVERICTRVSILAGGRIRACDTVGNLRQEKNQRKYLVIPAEPGQAGRAYDLILEIPGSIGCIRRNGAVEITLPEGGNPSAILVHLIRNGIRIDELKRMTQSLEDIYLRTVSEEGEGV